MAYIYDLTDTWNAGGTTFNAIKMNVTDSASAAASKLVTLQTNGTEHFSVTKAGVGYFSGNVGIGTASPQNKFVVSDGGAGGLEFLTNGLIQSYNRSGAAYQAMYLDAQSILLRPSGIEAMRIDSSGNVGIGTSSPGNKLTVAGAIESFAVSDTFAIFHTGSGLSYAGTTSNSAFGLVTNGGERMRITSAGNVGIGTSSPQLKLVVSNSGAAGLEISPDALASSPLIQSYNRSGAAYTQLGYNALQHVWQTSGIECARIDSSGNVGIGTSSPGAKLHVSASTTSGAYIIGPANVTSDLTDGTITLRQQIGAEAALGTTGAHALVLRTNNTERARIDSSGNLLVGTTSTNPTNGFVANTNSGNGFYTQTAHPNGTGSGVAYARYMYNQTEIGSITQSGTTAVAYNTSSDYRLKDIDGPITNSGAYIDALKPVQGSWKADGSRFIGLLAHEVQEVSETPIATGVKDGEEMQAMDYSAPEIIANLIAEIQSLRARVAQLEGN